MVKPQFCALKLRHWHLACTAYTFIITRLNAFVCLYYRKHLVNSSEQVLKALAKKPSKTGSAYVSPTFIKCASKQYLKILYYLLYKKKKNILVNKFAVWGVLNFDISKRFVSNNHQTRHNALRGADVLHSGTRVMVYQISLPETLTAMITRSWSQEWQILTNATNCVKSEKL